MPAHKHLLLIIPRYMQYGGRAYVIPMGILYVSAAAKRAGLSVHTLNLNHVGENPHGALRQYIIEHHIDIVGIGGLSGEYPDIAPVLAFVREHFPRITTIIGGGLVTAEPEVAMSALPQADIGIIGEGEECVPEVIRALECNKPLEDVQGIIFRKGDKLLRTAPRPDISDLDSLPFPDYEGFNYKAYLNENAAGKGPDGEKLSPVSVIGGRSCPYHCTFCFHPSGSTYRTRSLDSVFREIDWLLAHYNINYIALREELFAINPERIKAFCERISHYPIYWSVQLRMNQMTEEVMAALKKANCLYVFLGIESMDDTVLKSMRKGINTGQITRALQMAQTYGITTRSGLIFGDVAETPRSAARSLEWILEQHALPGQSDKLMLTADMIIPFPGSALYKDARHRNIISDPVAYLRHGCPIVNLTGMNRKDFLDMMAQVQQLNGRTYHVLEGEQLTSIHPPQSDNNKHISTP